MRIGERAFVLVIAIWCGDSSPFTHVTGLPASTVTLLGPKAKHMMLTSDLGAAEAAAAPTLSFSTPVGLNAAYSQSPLLHSAGYSVPQDVSFSITATQSLSLCCERT